MHEAAADYLNDINCSAYGSASGFDADFRFSPLEKSQGRQYVIHNGFIAHENIV
jgi:hypothetical protein